MSEHRERPFNTTRGGIGAWGGFRVVDVFFFIKDVVVDLFKTLKGGLNFVHHSLADICNKCHKRLPSI